MCRELFSHALIYPLRKKCISALSFFAFVICIYKMSYVDLCDVTIRPRSQSAVHHVVDASHTLRLKALHVTALFLNALFICLCFSVDDKLVDSDKRPSKTSLFKVNVML